MVKKIIPLKDRVVVKPKEQESTTASGFVLATKEKNDRPQTGVVLCVGDEVKTVKEGDEVVFKEFIPTTFEMENEKFLILSEEDILAKVE